MAVAPASVTEDGATNLVYTFTRTGVTTGALTVNFNVGGTATFGTDYAQSGVATFTTTTGTVTFAAGATTATVTIDPTADTAVESDETAVLTVVGFSVHDTIVVFDRIRENMVVSSRLTFEQVVNLSIMQTAARSIITSFTVVLVLLSLLVFGGDTLRGFALALLIGIVSGTYSSIFNASPLLVVWRRLQPVR